MRPHDDTPAPTIQVIGRMFALLDVLASHPQPVALKLLAERTGLHPSTAHRILNDLAWGGLVERPSSGHYALGPKFISLGRLSLARVDLLRSAGIAMKSLQQSLHLPVGLYAVREGKLVCLHEVGAQAAGAGSNEAASLEASAAGRSLLGGQAPAAAPGVLADPEADGSERLSAIVRDDAGAPVAALVIRSVAAAAAPQARAELQAAADAVSRALGWAPSAGQPQ